MKFYTIAYSLVMLVATAAHAEVIEIQSVEQFRDIIQNNSSVIADFYAPWCQPCLRMAPHFQTVSLSMPNVTFVKLSHSNPVVKNTLFNEYNVHSFPTLILFKNGEAIHTVHGTKTSAQLRNIAERLIS